MKITFDSDSFDTVIPQSVKIQTIEMLLLRSYSVLPIWSNRLNEFYWVPETSFKVKV